jgi:hypothetical protein
MKKALVLGVILLAVSSLAFADTGMGMWGRTAFDLAIGQSGTGASTDITQDFGVSFWPGQPRENVNLWFSSDKAAFNFTAYFWGAQFDPANSLVNAYGTLKLVPDMFTLLIGKFTGDGWDNFRKTSPHPIHDVNNGNVGRINGWAIIGDVQPKDTGIEVALAWLTAGPGTIPNTLAGNARNVVVAASYTMPNTVKITAGSTTANLDDETVASGATHENQLDRNVFGRVELLMVPNLTLWVDAKYWGFDAKPTSQTNIQAELAAAYSMDALTVVLAATFGNGEVFGITKSESAYAVYPEVYYNLGVATVGLYAMVGGSTITDSGIAYAFEPYVKLNDFNLRLSFYYTGSTATGAISNFEVPILIDFSF